MKGEVTIVLRNLGDLTGQPRFSGRWLPPQWVEWITTEFSDATITEELSDVPPGSLGMLVPRTKLVLKTKVFVWGLLRAASSAWVTAMLLGSAGPEASIGAASIGMLDALKQMKNALVKLNERTAEHCTYVAVVQAADVEVQRLGLFPSPDDIWRAHQAVREGCPITDCIHHDDGCKAKRGDIDVVLDRLKAAGVLETKGDQGLWPTR